MTLTHLRVERDGIAVHAWASREGVIALHVGEVPAVAITAGAHPVAGVAIGQGMGNAAMHELAGALERYLQGATFDWSGALDVRGIPAFSAAVFEAVRRIPYGRVTTYGAIAREIGRARSGRAVGTALHRNPFPIVVPCHRVLKEHGGLGGFACGLEMKRRLLALESGQRSIPFDRGTAPAARGIKPDSHE